jgi:hypothetical protein
MFLKTRKVLAFAVCRGPAALPQASARWTIRPRPRLSAIGVTADID